MSDIGWMMGPWTIIGNQHFGGAIFIYDGAPDYPGPERLWQMIQHHGITTLAISPTAIRVLMRSDSATNDSMDSLRLFGSTGEPWDDTSSLALQSRRQAPLADHQHFGRNRDRRLFPFPLPTQSLKPCTLGAPAPGMATGVFDEAGSPVRGKMGYLVCTKPAIGDARDLGGSRALHRSVLAGPCRGGGRDAGASGGR